MNDQPTTPADALFDMLKKMREARSGETQGGRPAAGQAGGASRRTKTVMVAVGALLVLVVAILTLSTFWTDLLWFGEVGYRGIFLTRIWAPLLVAVVAGAVFFAVFYLNLLLARRLSPRILVARKGADEEADVLELVPTPDRTVNRIILIGSLILAFFFAVGTSGGWQEIMLFFNRVDFGYVDPIFNRDASFYVFVLPLLRRLLSFCNWVVIITLIGVAVVYMTDRAITQKAEGRGLNLAPHVKGHLSVLAALLLLGKAADFLMQTWELLYSTRGVTSGASYTDVTAQLPVLRLLAIVAVISAVILLVNIYYRGWRLPTISVGLLVVMWIAAGQIYPAIIQQYRVSPNEIEVESPYIVHNIKATRVAFGLDGAVTTPFPAQQELTLADIEENAATIENVRLWDPRPLLETYSQLQEIRLYYSFRDVDIDRYTVDDNYRQIMLSAREMDQSSLQQQAKTWVNQHLTYTHGYGVVASAVNEVQGEGLPAFLVQDIPPQSSTDLQITRPEIYYGEIGNRFVMVQTTANEFDYPKGDENVFATYEGTGGVPISGLLERMAFTVRFQDLKLLFSEYLTPESRIMYKRTIAERVQAIAPFLRYDGDPYVVIRDDGSLVWLWDAYTSTSRFPYSQPTGNINYIRNSIKVVVDAYNGTVAFYQIDPDDALATSWGKLYPELLRPGSDLPDDLRRHLRYPEDLFSLQADKMTLYHMQDPQTFYNKEDVWQIPKEIYAGEEVSVVPYYVIMGLPGERQEEFILLQPFTPLERNNMVAWMGARMDGDNYGQIVIFDFPKDTLIYGPSQVEARISNDPEISAQITLWSQAGSRVIRGNLLVIPVEDSLMYVEPLFLQAEQSPIPELRRVIVNYGDVVAMEPTLAESLEKIFGAPTPPTTQAPTTSTTVPSGTTTTTVATTTTTPGTPLPTDAAELIARAESLYQRLIAAQQAGEWGTYGELLDELGLVLEQLAAVSQ